MPRNLKYDTNEPMEQKQTHRRREQTWGYQGGGRTRGMGGSLGLADANYYIGLAKRFVRVFP